MTVVLELVSFAAKALLVFVTFAACVTFLVARARGRRHATPSVHVHEVSKRWRRNALELEHVLRGDKSRLKLKDPAPAELPTARVFVVDYKGDVLASATESLREEVTAIVGVAAKDDEVVVRLESGGGTVSGYGLAAAQLARLRERGLRLTVCVDKIAASGGYMMACVADRIVSAPFAVLGSIGVVAPLPNAHRLLAEHGIDYQDVTAGKHKRPVSIFGPLTEEGLDKLKEQLSDTHEQFKAFVGRYRPGLDIESVATGEHWHGERAKELGLCDELGTSDDYLLARSKDARIFEIQCERPRSIRERAAQMADAASVLFARAPSSRSM